MGLPSTSLPSPGSPKALRQVQADEGDGDGDPDDEDALDEAGEGESCGGAAPGGGHGTGLVGVTGGGGALVETVEEAADTGVPSVPVRRPRATTSLRSRPWEGGEESAQVDC